MVTRLAGARLGALLVTGILIACSSGGGGPTSPSGAPVGTFVRSPAKAAIGPYGVPFGTDGGSRLQVVFSGGGEVGVARGAVDGTGWITAIEFVSDVGTTATVTCPDVSVDFGPASVTSLGTAFSANVDANGLPTVTVVSHRAVAFSPRNAGDALELPLDAPIYFDGLYNLLIEVRRTGACSGAVPVRADDTLPASALHASSVTAATGTLDVPPAIRLRFAGGAALARVADAGSFRNANWLPPLSAGRVQMLIRAEDVGGEGPITGMSFRSSEPAIEAATAEGVTITLAHIPATVQDLATDFAANLASTSGAVTVAHDLTIAVPPGTNRPVWIPFTAGTFDYDGTSNLFVEVVTSTVTSRNDVEYWNTPRRRTVLSSDPAAAVGGAWSRTVQPTFRFRGGTVDVWDPRMGHIGSGLPLADSSTSGGTQQALYRASDLGMGGRITAVYLRSFGSLTATTHPDLRVTMGHTARTALAGHYADNMDGARLLRSGPFEIPATVAFGRWLRIPLQTPFDYQPGKNLAVLFATSGAPYSNVVRWTRDAVAYDGLTMAGWGGTTTSGVLDPGLLDIRLEFER